MNTNHILTGYNTVFGDGEMVIAGLDSGSSHVPVRCSLRFSAVSVPRASIHDKKIEQRSVR